MNPFALVALAIFGVLAISIYIGANNKSNLNAEIQSQKQELESMKFDKDFANFFEDRKLEKPTDEEIRIQKEKIETSEARKRILDLEEDKRRSEMQKSIDELSGYKGKENED